MGSIQIMQEPWGRASQTDCCVGFLSGAFKGRDKVWTSGENCIMRRDVYVMV